MFCFNEHVVSHVCTTCPPGTTNAADDDASGVNTEFDATICSANEHVVSHVCTTCPPGTTNVAGNDASGGRLQNATPLYVVLTSMFLPMCAHRVLLVRLTLLVMTHRVMTRCVVNVLKIITSLPMCAHPVLLVRRTLEVMMPRVRHSMRRHFMFC